MWLPLHYIQKVHKVNYNITSTRYRNFPEHVPIQKWDIKRPQPRRNFPRVPGSRLQQAKITFGAYAQVYIGITNSTKQINVGVIALCPENEGGRNYFV